MKLLKIFSEKKNKIRFISSQMEGSIMFNKFGQKKQGDSLKVQFLHIP
jgi:hypothetical protein